MLAVQCGWCVVKCTLETGICGKMGGGVSPGECVFGIGTSGLHHFVEGDYSVAWFEFRDMFSYFVDVARDVVALVDWWLVWHGLRSLPV